MLVIDIKIISNKAVFNISWFFDIIYRYRYIIKLTEKITRIKVPVLNGYLNDRVVV